MIRFAPFALAAALLLPGTTSASAATLCQQHVCAELASLDRCDDHGTTDQCYCVDAAAGDRWVHACTI
jgi:hypothetical protein